MHTKQKVKDADFKKIGFGWGFDPLLSLTALKCSIDELFSEVFSNKATLRRETVYHPDANVYTDKNKCHIEIEFPGVSEKDIRFHITKDYLIAYAVKKPRKEPEEEKKYFQERKFGRFIKSVPLPVNINPEKFNAIFQDGVLEITAEMKK